MKNVPLALALAAFVAAPVWGQDASGKKLLEGLRGFDAKLAKAYTLGFYLGSKNMGHATVVVAQAPPSTGATYRLELKMKVALGAQRMEGTEVQLLDEKLALVSRTETETERKGDAARTNSSSVKKVAGEWVYAAKRGEKSAGCRLLDDGADHWESSVLLARKVPLKPATYTLRGIQWPAWGLLQRTEPPKVSYRDMTITVPAAKPFLHRGKTVQAHTIVVARTGVDKLAVVIDSKGELLAMWEIGGPPIKFIAGTAEECKRDLAGAKPKGPQPVDAVLVYFKVMFKALPIDKLDAVMDWTAIKNGMGRGDADVDAFAKELKAQFEKQPAPPNKEVLGYLGSLLRTRTKGNMAEVYLDSRKKDVFKLRKAADGTWKITHFPH